MDSVGYDVQEKELKSLEGAYPEYIKSDRVYYQELLQEIRKKIKKGGRKVKTRDKDFVSILEIIKRKVDYDPGNLSDEFNTLDRDKEGYVYLEECLEIINEILDGKMTQNLENQFCDKLLCLKDQMIDYKKVVSLVFTGKTSLDRIYETMNHAIVNEFADQLREEMNLRQVPSFEFFRYFDVNGDKKITLDEFIEETNRICISFSDSELKLIYQEIMDNYCTHRNKKFDLETFRKYIFGYKLEDIRPLLNHIRAELSYRNKSVNKFFYESDKKRDRVLTFNEFFHAIKKLDANISPLEVDILFSYLDTDNSKSISIDEFIDKVSEPSSMNEYSQLIDIYIRKNRYDIPYLISQYTASKDKSKLTLPQFMKMSREICGSGLKEKELKGIFEEVDQNEDKYISVEEFEYLFDKEICDNFNKNFGRLKVEILEELSESKQNMRQFFNSFASTQGPKSSRRGRKESKRSTNELFWDLSDLRRCLISYNIELRETDELSLFDLLDSDRDEMISMTEFRKAILGKKVNTKNLIKAIRRVIKKDQIDVRKIGRNMDIDGNNKIDFKEFCDYLENLKLNFSYKDMVYLFEKLDSDKSSTIDYDELMNIFDSSPKKKNTHHNTMVLLLEDLQKTTNWEDTFTELDTSDRGLTATKFVRFLNEINSRLDKFEGYEVFSKLDFKNKGTLSLYELEDFIDDSNQHKNGLSAKTGKGSNLWKQNQENLTEMRESLADAKKDGLGLFKVTDYNNDGYVPKRQFEQILKENQILVGNSKIVRQLLAYYQKPHSVLIDFNTLFEDMKKLKPRIPNFALFLADDLIHVCKRQKKDLKDLFLVEEADIGDYDGKMTLSEFSKFITKYWGEGGKVKIELKSKGKNQRPRTIRR